MDLHQDTIQLRVPPQLRREPEPEAAPKPRGGGRDRYLDLLRALALVRVVLYHHFSWAWLPLVFPSMGIMFSLAGSLMARSLSRPAPGVIRGRLRRLLPPMWLFGAIVITAMVLDGWRPGTGRWWAKLLFWVLPLSDPPFGTGLHGFHGFLGPDWAAPAVEPLWYLRAYLWFVLLSPLLLRALRRFPLPTLLAPLALAVLLNSGVVDLGGRLWDIATDFSTYGACWVLGMARQEGLLRRIPQYLAPSIAPLIMVTGLWLYLGRPIVDPTVRTDIDGLPVAQAVWSVGCVLLLLHLSPSWEEWPSRLERWNGLISLLNSRAVSVYIWHNLALTLALGLTNQLWNVHSVVVHARWLLTSQWFPLMVAVPLIALAVLAFGWIEDVAAKRPPRLFPYPRRRRPPGKRRATA